MKSNDPGRRRLRAVVAACLHEQRAALVLALLALAGGVAAELAAPWPLKLIFDQILLGRPLPDGLAWLQPLIALPAWPALLVLALAIGAIALAGGALQYLQLFNSSKIGHRITWALRGELFAHLQRQSLAYHRDSRTGELMTKVAGDTNLLRDAFADWSLTVLRHALTLVGMLAVMAWVNLRLAALVAATLPPLLLAIYVLNRRVKDSAQRQRKLEGRMSTRLHEVLSSIALVQAFGREVDEGERFQREIEANFESGMRAARAQGAVVKAVAVLSAAGTAMVVLFGAAEVLAGRLAPGELLVFMAYVTGLYKPVRDLAKLAAKFARAGVSLRRVADVLAAEPEIEDAPDALDLGTPAGEIVFEDVHFGYGDKPVLCGVSLRIAAGEHVAIVGPSGAGKSTLVNLILRLAEPERGRVLLDGLDVRRLRRASLRQPFGIVLQEHLLLGTSVRENIAYGRPDAPQTDIEAAARAARAHEFIVDLPQGYDTVLGERGATLSGGQRQRLCLARALVKQPAVLVMDEPTAAVDAASARLMHEAVARAQHGRTLIVITHDEHDLARYDRVLRLRDGRIEELDIQAPRGLRLVETRHA